MRFRAAVDYRHVKREKMALRRDGWHVVAERRHVEAMVGPSMDSACLRLWGRKHATRLGREPDIPCHYFDPLFHIREFHSLRNAVRGENRVTIPSIQSE
jgi:hypothetical protein